MPSPPQGSPVCLLRDVSAVYYSTQLNFQKWERIVFSNCENMDYKSYCRVRNFQSFRTHPEPFNTFNMKTIVSLVCSITRDCSAQEISLDIGPWYCLRPVPLLPVRPLSLLLPHTALLNLRGTLLPQGDPPLPQPDLQPGGLHPPRHRRHPRLHQQEPQPGQLRPADQGLLGLNPGR